MVTAVGIHLIYNGYLFIDDEYSGWFQSVIFANGRRTATVPAPWCTWIAGLAPTWCMEIRYTIRGADGASVQGVVHNTVHRLGD